MKTVVFFLEELSAKVMLDGLLRRILSEDIIYQCIIFEGKQDLEKQLPGKLRGWRTPNTWFVILRDQDKGDCVLIKARLAEICRVAEKPSALIRIACHELESWYLGDLRAVEKGLKIPGLAEKQHNQKFRDPDRLSDPVRQLQKLTRNKYQKVAGSRQIGPHLSLNSNQSHSFGVFLSGMTRIIERMNSNH